MSFPRPIQWYRSHAVIIWPVHTFNFRFQIVPNELSFCPFFLMVASFYQQYCTQMNEKTLREKLNKNLLKITILSRAKKGKLQDTRILQIF
jgi:hypothetical protein